MDFSNCDPPVRRIHRVVGGVVDIENMVGRDEILVQAQRAVTESEGLVLVGDRRMGKTSLLRRLRHDWINAGHRVVFISAQTSSAKVVTNALMDELRTDSWLVTERERWAMNVNLEAGGLQLHRKGGRGEPSPPPEDFIGFAARKLAPQQLFLIIDELALFLLRCKDISQDAEEFVRYLRRVRQQNDNVTVVIAGSIGLHHVVPGSNALNDVHHILVGPLTPCEALELALGLLADQGINDRSLAEEMVRVADSIPYYIQWLASNLEIDPDPRLTPGKRLDQAFGDPHNELDAGHYDRRLDDYYGAEAEVARELLDILSDGTPRKVDVLLARLGAAELTSRPTRDELINMIGQLERDNYLRRDENGAEQFANQVLIRIWRAIRRLD